MKNYVKNYNMLDDYVNYEIRHDYQDQSQMLPYLYVFPTEEETQKYVEYLTGYISQILEHTHTWRLKYKVYLYLWCFIIYIPIK
jgi:hypothetical protein